VEERDGGLVGLQLSDAARTGRQVALEIRVDIRRKMMFDEVRQESDEVVTAAFLWHGNQSGSRVSGLEVP